MSPPTIRSTQGNTTSQAQGPQYAKVFVQRDYSDGTAVKFMTNFPQGLENKASFSPTNLSTIKRILLMIYLITD